MTDAEFEALIDAAKARLALDIEVSFSKAKADIRASFQEARANLNARFDKAAKDLGIDLANTATSSDVSILPQPKPEHFFTEFCP